jgi:hypothetical protein
MAMAGMGVSAITQGFHQARVAAMTAEAGQMAVARMVKELSAIRTISSATTTSISYTRIDGTTHTLLWNGGTAPILLDGATLIDGVNQFSLSYFNAFNSSASSYSAATALIEISLTLNRAPGNAFVNRVVLRRAYG